jgi:hypothetical protein
MHKTLEVFKNLQGFRKIVGKPPGKCTKPWRFSKTSRVLEK